MKTHYKKNWPVAIKSIVMAMAGAGLVSLPYMVYANPTGGQVVAGNVTIRQESASKVGITQSTAKGIIDWQKYSIGANEQVQYYQPSASSVTLNRVVGQDPSQILGRLTANGQIFLVNPNGIYFGKNAQVDVAGLVASTHNIRNEDFLAGKYNFNIPGKPGASVINEGTIRIADTGIAAFVAPSVANRGVIVARLGKVAMAAANGFTLDFHGDQLLSFLVKDDVAQTAFDIDGKQLTSFVENSGRIEAQGGYVLLTAKAAENAIHGVINHSGVIEATTVGTKNGEIILHAGTGSLQVSGTLDASAPNGGDGGFIETSGAQLSISPDIKITTLAATGKNGSWLIDPFNILVGTGGISPNALNTATSNIILEATNDITFQSPVSVTQAGVGLTAKAGRNIQVDANISTNNGEINLLAGFDSFTNAAGVNDGKVIINGARVNSGTAARNIIGRGPSTDGLVGYWTFDGNAKDGSGNANNGSSLGNVTFTSDGTRDIVKFGGIYSPGSVVVANNSSLHFSSNMTLSYWVRIDSTVGMNGYGGAATIGSVGTTVAKSHDRSGFFSLMGTGSNGEYYSTFGNDVYRSTSAGVSSLTGESTASSIGQWVHVAYTFSANEAKVYINGALKNSVSSPINFSIANTQNLYFGKFSDSWYPLNGALDEVRLYNQTLSSNRISEIYSGAMPPVTPPVVNNPIISGSFIPTPKEEVFIASAVSYSFKNPITETGDVFDQFVGGKIKSKTESVPINDSAINDWVINNKAKQAGDQFSGEGTTIYQGIVVEDAVAYDYLTQVAEEAFDAVFIKPGQDNLDALNELYDALDDPNRAGFWDKFASWGTYLGKVSSTSASAAITATGAPGLATLAAKSVWGENIDQWSTSLNMSQDEINNSKKIAGIVIDTAGFVKSIADIAKSSNDIINKTNEFLKNKDLLTKSGKIKLSTREGKLLKSLIDKSKSDGTSLINDELALIFSIKDQISKYEFEQ